MTVYLIDGYNVLHQLPAEGTPGRRRSTRFGDQAELESRRRRLVDRIAGFIASEGARAIIVFDSKGSEIERSESVGPDVDVYFGSFSRSADAIIEREAYGLKDEERIVVVTSDYAVQKTTFLPNVARRSSRQFVQDLQGFTTRLANSKDCTTMGHRVEERINETSLDRLKRLRDSLEGGSDS